MPFSLSGTGVGTGGAAATTGSTANVLNGGFTLTGATTFGVTNSGDTLSVASITGAGFGLTEKGAGNLTANCSLSHGTGSSFTHEWHRNGDAYRKLIAIPVELLSTQVALSK